MHRYGGSLPASQECCIYKAFPNSHVIKKGLWVLFFLVFVVSFPVGLSQAAVILNSSLSISGEYTDNLFFSETDKKSDFSTIVSPAMKIDFTSRHVTLNVGYRGSAIFYSQNSQADGYFQSLAFDIDFPGLNRQIRGLKVKFIERVSFSPELNAYSFGDPNLTQEERFSQVLQEGEGIQGDRVDTFRNVAGVELSYSWTQNFETTATYTNVITRYSGSAIEDTEVNVTTLDGTYHYQVTSRTEWKARYGVAASFGDNQERDALIHQVSVGVEHQVTRLLSVNGDIGVSFVEGESPEMLFEAGITKRYRKGILSLQYTSNVVAGLGVIQGAVRRESVVGEATRSIGEVTTSYLQVGYANNRSFEANRIDVSTYTVQTGVSTRLLSWLQGMISYSYLKQRDQGNFSENGVRNVINISLTASAPAMRLIK